MGVEHGCALNATHKIVFNFFTKASLKILSK